MEERGGAQPYVYSDQPSASSPYFFGSSFTGMTWESSALIVFGLQPMTDIFASVFAETSGLKSQKIHMSRVGTLMKYLRDRVGRAGVHVACAVCGNESAVRERERRTGNSG